jgi:hypothetical protein
MVRRSHVLVMIRNCVYLLGAGFALGASLPGCGGDSSESSTITTTSVTTQQQTGDGQNNNPPPTPPTPPTPPSPPPGPMLPTIFTLQAFNVEETSAVAALPSVWLSGDTHVHNDHSSDGSALRQGIQGAGPGNVSVADQIFAVTTFSSLDWLPMTDHRTYVQHYDPLWTSDKLLLIPGEEANSGPHATVLGAVESIIQNGRTTDLASRNAALQQSIWDSMSQNASYGLAHPDDGVLASPDGAPNQNGHVVGLDRVEMWNRGSNAEDELSYAEHRWNAGYRIAVVGASDVHFKELWPVTPPGSPKTWVYAAGATERGILTGIHRQNTFVSLGNPDPSLTFQMDRDNDNRYETIAGDEVIMPRQAVQRLRFRVITDQFAVGMTLNVYQAPGRSAGKALTQPITSSGQIIDFELPWNGTNGDTWFRAELRQTGLPAAVDTNALRSLDFQKILTEQTTYPEQLRALTTPIFVSSVLIESRASDGKKLLPDEDKTSDSAVRISRNPGRFTGFSDVARTGKGLFSVWEEHSPSGTRILGRVIKANGAFEPAVVLSGTSAAARFARVAARGDLVWIVWEDERSGQKPRNAAIYARYSRDGGMTWFPEIKVRQQVSSRSEKPALVIPKDSDIPMIAWQEIFNGTSNGVTAPSDATGFDVFVAQGSGTVSTGSVSFSSVKNISITGKSAYKAQDPSDTRAARYWASVRPSLALAETTGEIALAYQDNRNDPDPLWTGATGTGDSHDNDIFQIRVHSLRNGQWDAGVTLGAATMEDRHPSIYFKDDKPVVAWVPRGVDNAGGVNLRVLAADRNCVDSMNNVVWCAPINLGDTGTTGSGQFVRLGKDLNSNLVAFWYDSRSTDWRFKLGFVLLNSNRVWGPFKLIKAPGNNTWPALTEGYVSFTSSRNAQRLQRDKTHEVFVRAVD